MNIIPDKEKIIEHMYKQGISITQFSKLSGVSKICIMKIGNGSTKTVRPKTAKAIADTLEMSFDDLFTIQ